MSCLGRFTLCKVCRKEFDANEVMPFNAPILYVEDEVAFVDHLVFTLGRVGCTRRLVHLSDGEEAIAYLSHSGKYADRQEYPLPSLILLDLKLPRIGGFEVLRWIREKSDFPCIPVVMMTVSDEMKDVQEAYRRGAQSFLIKPILADDLKELLKTWEKHWLPNVRRMLGGGLNSAPAARPRI